MWERVFSFIYKISELEQAAALKYLYSWLRHHPKYGAIASPDQPENLYYADVSLFLGAINTHAQIPLVYAFSILH